MQTIISVKKTDTGVEVVWHENKQEMHDFFSDEEFNQMRIHVDDLIEHPTKYRIDLQEHKIYTSAKGGGSF
jgi:predicted RNA-binding protein